MLYKEILIISEKNSIRTKFIDYISTYEIITTATSSLMTFTRSNFIKNNESDMNFNKNMIYLFQ